MSEIEVSVQFAEACLFCLCHLYVFCRRMNYAEIACLDIDQIFELPFQDG